MSVVEREDASHWTRQAVRAVTAWAFQNEGELPEDASAYKHRAITYMNTHAAFETNGFVDMVLNEADPERRELFEVSLNDALAQKGVAGQQFSPKPGSLPTNTKRNKRVTIEGVTVEWEGDPSAAGISFESIEDGRQRIVIDTTGFKQKS